MFLISGPELVIAACKAGVIGAFPTLNARPVAQLEEWFTQIKAELSENDAPWAANLIVHKSNQRFQPDFELIQEFQPEIVITSLGSPERVADQVHNYGGLVFSDVNSVEFARKAADRGADGLILICAGAGGHTGFTNSADFIAEVREFFNGPLIAGGAISTGMDIKRVIDEGADFAYMGTRFIATQECRAQPAYKQMIVESGADDIILTPYFTGIPANFLLPSIKAAGIDAAILEQAKGEISFDPDENDASAWKDIWSAGIGVEHIHDAPGAAELITRLEQEFKQ